MMSSVHNNREARESILKSIRDHLAASRAHDPVHGEIKDEMNRLHHSRPNVTLTLNGDGDLSLVEQFRNSLNSVDGNCIVADDEAGVVESMKQIIENLRGTPLHPRRIAVSDSALVQRLAKQLEPEVEEIAITPDAASLFAYDLGISSAQVAIAETGTLVLKSTDERHRLVSLLPPVHIALVEARKICRTLGEALQLLRPDGAELSPAITFVTGPSRTADIELTLAIGVHGPQKLFVIIY
jgi:L-lactate dehydrogenase complex protein LldG